MKFKGVISALPVAFLATAILWPFRIVARIALALASVAFRMTVLLSIVVWSITTEAFHSHTNLDQ